MNNVVAVHIPDGVDGDAARAAMLERLRHRDRHLVRSAARQGLADRHHGLQRPQRRRAGHPGRARAGAARHGVPRHRRRRRRARPRRSTRERPRDAGTTEAVLARCAELDRFSAAPHGLERVHLSPEHAAANALRRAAGCGRPGCATWQDAAGNQWGRREGREPGLPALRARLAPRHRARRRPLRRHARRGDGDRGRRAARRPGRRRCPSRSRWSGSATRRAPGSARRCWAAAPSPAPGTTTGGTCATATA